MIQPRIKTIISGFLFVLLISSLVLSGCTSTPTPAPTQTSAPAAKTTPPAASTSAAPAASGKTYNLSLSFWASATHPVRIQAYDPFCAAVKQRTNGAVNITIYPGGALANANESYNKMKDGLIDISMFIPDNVPGVFNIGSSLGRLPFVGDSLIAATKAFWDVYNAKLMDDAMYSTMHLLYPSASDAAGALFTSKKQVVKVEDIKGLRLRSTGEMISASISAMGATPVNITGAEFQVALSSGVIDGGVTPYASAKDYGMVGTAKYATEWHPALGLGFIGLAMNQKAYDGLPADIQKIFDEEAVKAGINQAQSYVDSGVTAKQDFVKSGVQVTIVQGADITPWSQKTTSVVDNWLKEMEKAGQKDKAQKAVNLYLESFKKYESQK
jgi:TRAP-type C4-dicarboxylate transport system substrate-binding protein